MTGASDDELCFWVDEWTDDGGRIRSRLSMSMNALIALAAFEAAVKLRPERWITVRHKSRVFGEHIPEKLRIAQEKRREEMERLEAEARAAYEARAARSGEPGETL